MGGGYVGDRLGEEYEDFHRHLDSRWNWSFRKLAFRRPNKKDIDKGNGFLDKIIDDLKTDKV